LAQEVFDNLEGIVRVYDNEEDFTTPAVAARHALIRAEGRLINAQQSYGAALDAHSLFLNARFEATRRLGTSDSRGKATTDVDEEEELVDPKFLKRKLPEPSECFRVSRTELTQARLLSASAHRGSRGVC